MIYLDNAATTGTKPLSVIKAVEEGLKYYSANPGRGGHKLSVAAATKVFEARSKLKNFFNCRLENSVCFTSNCTMSINTVLYGTLQKGDHIIVSDLEHNAVMRPLYALKEERGVEIDFLNICLDDPDSSPIALENKIKSNTRMVLVTHSSNVTGTILPIKKIGEVCKKHGILFCVDAAQSAGHLDINVKDMNIDFLCVAPHKGLYAPMGTGILICEKPINRVLVKGGTGVNSISLEQPEDFPERLESGTINLPGIFGISSGVDFISKKEVKFKIKKENELIDNLYNGLRKEGAILYTPEPRKIMCTPVLSFNLPNRSSEETASFLAEYSVCVRGGLQCAPLAHKKLGTIDRGMVRVSTSVFNNNEHIEKLLLLIKKFKKTY